MTINLADNDPRNEYTVADGNSQTIFTMTFEIFDNADLNVYVDGTLQTLTTHYKISDSNTDANAGHTSGTDGFVHFTSAVTASGSDKKVVFTRSIDLERTTDFPASGAFQIGSLNAELDKIIAIQADLKDDIDRSLRLTDFDLDATLTLPAVDTRKGKTLAFNATTGAVEAGPSIGDVQTVSAASADIATLADIEDGTDATDAIQTVAGISGNVTTVAGISSNVTTVAGQTTNLQNVTNNLTAIQNAAQNATDAADAKTAAETAQAAAEAALDTFDDRFLGAKSGSEPTVDNDGNALLDGALYFDTDVGLMKVYDQSGTQWVQLALTGTNQTNVNLVAGQISPTNNISTVAGAIGDGTFANATTFAAKYRTGTTDPTDSLDAGDLFFNTTSNTLKVYNGSGWVDATLQGATISTFEFTATAGQTAFTGNDDNGTSLNYNTANALVTINGVIIPSSDYTTTSATTLTLDADAAAEAGDSVIIISYSEFSANVANIVTDTSPQLGGNLDVNGNSIVSTSDGDINITPNGTGKVKVDNVSIDGNTIASEDTNGDLVLTPNGTGDVEINSNRLNLNYTDDDAFAGPYLRLNRVSASPADSDEIGRIEFNANDSAGNETTYASITGRTDDVTNSSEDGRLRFFVRGTTSGTGGYSTMSLRSSSGTAHLSFGGNARIHWGDWGGSALDGDLYLRPYIAQNLSEVDNTRTIELPDESGLLSYVEQHRTVASDVAQIDFDNLPTLFESYVFKYRLHPVTDNDYFKIQFLDSSGTVIGGSSYGYSRVQNGSHASSNTAASIPATSGIVGNNSYEGIRGEAVLLGRNYVADDTDSVPPTVVGRHSFINGSGVRTGVTYQGGLHTTSQQAIRGIRFAFNTGNIDSGVISIAGIQEAV